MPVFLLDATQRRKSYLGTQGPGRNIHAYILKVPVKLVPRKLTPSIIHLTLLI